MAPVITLTTDFGLSDHYVAALKGSILSLNPHATIVDISHDIRPQDTEHAAFLLGCTHGYFPPGSIHVVIVDPGVGTERHALALSTAGGVFVGPDNGVLSVALPERLRRAAASVPSTISLHEPVRAYCLTDSRFHRATVSPTFHARDIFAPVSAHISLGVALSELGPAVRDIIALPPFRAEAAADGSLMGRVIHIDRFGNVITTVRADQLPSGAKVMIAGSVISALTRTYAESAGLIALIGSCGYLEIALTGGSAEKELRVAPGDPVIVQSD
jgi:S-adenosylmethionine hydrolase